MRISGTGSCVRQRCHLAGAALVLDHAPRAILGQDDVAPGGRGKNNIAPVGAEGIADVETVEAHLLTGLADIDDAVDASRQSGRAGS